MKKMMLKLDDLRVDSFDTTSRREHRGTVAGFDSTGCGTEDACCWAGTHGGYPCDTTRQQIYCTSVTDENSRNGTCMETCPTCVDTCATCGNNFCDDTVNCHTVPGYNGCY